MLPDLGAVAGDPEREPLAQAWSTRVRMTSFLPKPASYLSVSMLGNLQPEGRKSTVPSTEVPFVKKYLPSMNERQWLCNSCKNRLTSEYVSGVGGESLFKLLMR